MTFIEACVAGEASWRDVHDYVDDWHNSNSELELHEYLGLTELEYKHWVENPDTMAAIVVMHKKRIVQ